MGRLALATVYPDLYSQVLLQARNAPPACLCELERQHFATDHNEMTAALLGDWGMPEICLEAAQYHEQPHLYINPDDDRTVQFVHYLHLANCIADICVAPDLNRPALVWTLLTSCTFFEIPENELILLGDRIVAEWQEWGRLLAIKTLAVPTFAELLQQARQNQEADKAILNAVAGMDTDQGLLGVNQPVAPVEAETEGPQITMNVVIISQDSDERRTLQSHLVNAGHNVQIAAEGVEGLRLVLDTNPQLVITDWRVPGIDGAALCKTLRQSKWGQQLYLMVFTTPEAEEVQVEAFEAGADEFLIKPIRFPILHARLQACQRLLCLREEVRRDKEELRRLMANLAVANRQLQQAALTDPLTGLSNRRYATDRLDQEWASAERLHHAWVA